jgi:hypothetical protein
MNRLDSHVAFGVPPGRSLRQSTLPLVKGDFADPGQIVTDRCCLRVALLGSVRVREGESGPSLCLQVVCAVRRPFDICSLDQRQRRLEWFCRGRERRAALSEPIDSRSNTAALLYHANLANLVGVVGL